MLKNGRSTAVGLTQFLCEPPNIISAFCSASGSFEKRPDVMFHRIDFNERRASQTRRDDVGKQLHVCIDLNLFQD